MYKRKYLGIFIYVLLFYFNFIISKKVISVRILLSLDGKQSATFHRRTVHDRQEKGMVGVG